MGVTVKRVTGDEGLLYGPLEKQESRAVARKPRDAACFAYTEQLNSIVIYL